MVQRAILHVDRKILMQKEGNSILLHLCENQAVLLKSKYAPLVEL